MAPIGECLDQESVLRFSINNGAIGPVRLLGFKFLDMMRILVAVLLTVSFNSFIFFDVSAQKKKSANAEFQKIQEELMKEMKDMSPEERKKAMELMKQAEKAMAKAGPESMKEIEDTARYFPSKSKLLASIPARVMTKQELQQYTAAIYTTVVSNISPAHKKEIDQIVATNRPDKLSQLAIAGWYYKKAPVTAIALAAKAGEKNIDDAIALNNLAALLNQGNVPQKAIPVLLYLLQKNPGDAMMLNNLGQSYAALGDKTNARLYLLRCVKINPKHPEANNTLAHIEAAEGNNTKATEYAKASLEGAFTLAAANLLRKVEPKKVYEANLPKINLPDHFNEYKIKLPRLQLLVDEGPAITAETYAFGEALQKESGKLYALYSPLEKEGIKLLQAEQQKLMSNPERLNQFGRTFSYLATYKLMEAAKNSPADEDMFKALEQDYQLQIAELENKHAKKQQSIRKEYAEKMKGLYCGDGRANDCAKLDKLNKELCAKLSEAATLYLKDRAAATENYRRKKQNNALKFFYFNSYWQYLSANNKQLAHGAYYKTAQDYISSLKLFNRPYTINPPCGYPEQKKAKQDIPLSWNMECPVDISISFIVGKLKVNCEEAGFSMGEGAQFSFTQNFITRQSTFSIGIGASVSKEISLPGAEAKLEAGLSQSLYITYDGINKITDLGMKFGAGVSAGYGFSGSLSGSGDGVVTGVGISKDGGSIKGEVGYTIGINSGYGPHIDFEEGPIKKLFAGEKQVNPKVNIYQK